MRPANPYFFESLILLQVGKRYAAKVVKMMDYGVFVELSSGSQGLLHISEIALEKVLPLPPLVAIIPSFPIGFRAFDIVSLHVQQITCNTQKFDPCSALCRHLTLLPLYHRSAVWTMCCRWVRAWKWCSWVRMPRGGSASLGRPLCNSASPKTCEQN